MFLDPKDYSINCVEETPVTIISFEWCHFSLKLSGKIQQGGVDSHFTWICLSESCVHVHVRVCMCVGACV